MILWATSISPLVIFRFSRNFSYLSCTLKILLYSSRDAGKLFADFDNGIVIYRRSVVDPVHPTVALCNVVCRVVRVLKNIYFFAWSIWKMSPSHDIMLIYRVRGSLFTERGQSWAKKEEIARIGFFAMERANAKMDDMFTNTSMLMGKHSLFIAGNLKKRTGSHDVISFKSVK